MILRKKRFRRVFGAGFCTDWIEIYRIIPRPKVEGAFFLAFRERRKRKVLPLFCGITIGGVERLIKILKQGLYDPTELSLFIGSRLRDERFRLVSLAN
jgi:hypothetical protein